MAMMGWLAPCVSLLLLGAWLAHPAGASAAAPAAAPRQAPALTDKRVLVLSSYAYGRPAVDTFVRTYIATLSAGGVARGNINVEYLNLDRDTAPEHRSGLRALLMLRHGGKPVDLVVALQQPAQNFLLGELAALAPAAPLILFNLAQRDHASFGQRPILSLEPSQAVRNTLVQALRLFPDTERIIVTVGTSPSDQIEKKQIEAALATLGHRAVVDYTDTLAVGAILAKVAAAPPRTIVLQALINRDGAGTTVIPSEMANAVSRAARAPTFVPFSSMIGEGALGGAVQHVERMAQQAGSSSLEVLSGQRQLAPGVARIPVPSASMYDWQQLARWDADPDLLPDDTLFINRPASLWREHRAELLAGAGVIGLLVLLSASLLVQRRRLLQVQLHSRASEARVRVLVEHSPEAIVVYDAASARLVDANTKAERLFGCSRDELLSGGLARFYPADQPDGLAPAETMPANAERALAGAQVVLERTVIARDGRTFPCEVSVVALPSTGGSLLRCGFVDISERKRVEQELERYRNELEEQVAERTEALSMAVRDAEAAHRAKNVFLANMSHELRTPLNAVIGFSHIMSESTSLFDEEKRNLGIIHRSGQHLLGLINDILELSRIEAGQPGLLDESPGAGAGRAPAGTAAPAAHTVDAQALLVLPLVLRRRLHSALQQLDMASVGALLDTLRRGHPDLASGVDAMVSAHQYPQLCALLDLAAGDSA